MSWLAEFDAELEARGIAPAQRERLVAELADHIACEQGAPTRLGPAREIAGQYADELGAELIRHGAAAVFAALSCAALALVVSQLTLGRVGYPGFNHGFSTPLALAAIVAILIGPQVALVGGTLAAWRALRRRHAAVMPAAEIALVRRRAQVGLGAGAVTAAGLLLYTANFIGVLPAWWLALSGGLAAGAMAALLSASRVLARGGSTVVLAGGPAGDLFDDLAPLRALRGHPLLLWLSAALVCGGLVTLAAWHAERSLTEGLERGLFEAVALSIGFAALGRTIGARR